MARVVAGGSSHRYSNIYCTVYALCRKSDLCIPRKETVRHSGTEVVLVREGPRAGGGSSQRKKGSDYFTSPVKTMTLGI